MRRVVFVFFLVMFLLLLYLTYRVYADWAAAGGICP